jgi:hypothetical protein
MRTRFDVHGKSYEADIKRLEKREDEKFEICRASVCGPDGESVVGTLKLTDTAIALAEERASEQGGSTEEWLGRGCSRSLAAELVIRPLTADFSFVVDHRWIDYQTPVASLQSSADD